MKHNNFIASLFITIASAKQQLGVVLNNDFTTDDLTTYANAGYTSLYLRGLNLDGNCYSSSTCNFFQKLDDQTRSDYLNLIDSLDLDLIITVEDQPDNWISALNNQTANSGEYIQNFLSQNGLQGVNFAVELPEKTTNSNYQSGQFTNFLATLIDNLLQFDNNYFMAITANPIYFSPSNVNVPDSSYNSNILALQTSFLGLCNTLTASSYYSVSQHFKTDSCILNEGFSAYQTYDNMFMQNTFSRYNENNPHANEFDYTSVAELHTQVEKTGFYLQHNHLNIMKPASMYQGSYLVPGYVESKSLAEWQCNARLGVPNWQGYYINGFSEDISVDVDFAEQINKFNC